MKKKFFVILLVLIQIFCIAACGKASEGSTNRKEKNTEVEAKDVSMGQQIRAYTIGNSSEKSDMRIISYDVAENTVCYCGSYVKNSGGDSLSYAIQLWKMNTDGGGKKLLTELDMNDMSITDMCIKDGGNILLLGSKGDLDAGGSYVIFEYSPAGELIKEHDLGTLLQGAAPISIEYSNGICFLADVGVVYALNLNSSQLVYSFKSGSCIPYISFLKDGRLIAGYPEENTFSLKILSPADGSVQTEKTFDVPYISAYGGLTWDIYLDDGKALYGYMPDSGRMEKIITWSSLGILGGRVTELPEGGFICRGRTDFDSIDPLFVLREEALPEGGEMHTLILATVAGNDYGSGLKDMINSWNRANPFSKIELRDYSVYSSSDNPQGAQLQMAKDVASGIIPDIYDFAPAVNEDYTSISLNPASMAKRGLLEDLNPYIDSDPEIRREDIFDNLLKAFEIDGGLYEIFGQYSFLTAYGPASLTGGPENRNYENLRRIAYSNGFGSAFGSDWEDKADLLIQLVEKSGTKLVDWSKGECYFESEYFMNLLREVSVPYAGLNVDTPHMIDRLKNRNGLLIIDTQSTMWCPTAPSVFGDDFEYTGLPEVGNAVSTAGTFGISSSSNYKDECWAFLRRQLLPANDFSVSLSMRRDEVAALKVFELSRAKEDGVMQHHPYIEHAMDKLISAIAQVEIGVRPDAQIRAIVSSEAADYFAGVRSAEETAANIQARVSIYMAEQS